MCYRQRQTKDTQAQNLLHKRSALLHQAKNIIFKLNATKNRGANFDYRVSQEHCHKNDEAFKKKSYTESQSYPKYTRYA